MVVWTETQRGNVERKELKATSQPLLYTGIYIYHVKWSIHLFHLNRQDVPWMKDSSSFVYSRPYSSCMYDLHHSNLFITCKHDLKTTLSTLHLQKNKFKNKISFNTLTLGWACDLRSSSSKVSFSMNSGGLKNFVWVWMVNLEGQIKFYSIFISLSSLKSPERKRKYASAMIVKNYHV